MEEKLVYENTYGDHLDVGGTIEHFYDSFPSEWGQMVDDYDEKTSYLDNSHECIVVMENGMKVRIEMMRRGFARRIKYLNKSVIWSERGMENERHLE